VTSLNVNLTRTVVELHARNDAVPPDQGCVHGRNPSIILWMEAHYLLTYLLALITYSALPLTAPQFIAVPVHGGGRWPRRKLLLPPVTRSIRCISSIPCGGAFPNAVVLPLPETIDETTLFCSQFHLWFTIYFLAYLGLFTVCFWVSDSFLSLQLVSVYVLVPLPSLLWHYFIDISYLLFHV
jgi:hypothetical protein